MTVQCSVVQLVFAGRGPAYDKTPPWTKNKLWFFYSLTLTLMNMAFHFFLSLMSSKCCLAGFIKSVFFSFQCLNVHDHWPWKAEPMTNGTSFSMWLPYLPSLKLCTKNAPFSLTIPVFSDGNQLKVKQSLDILIIQVFVASTAWKMMPSCSPGGGDDGPAGHQYAVHGAGLHPCCPYLDLVEVFPRDSLTNCN